MATRAYYRDSRGRYAGSAGSAQVTYDKAGGFASGGGRARVGGGSRVTVNSSKPRRVARASGNMVRKGMGFPPNSGKRNGQGQYATKTQGSFSKRMSKASNANVQHSYAKKRRAQDETAVRAKVTIGSRVRKGAKSTGRFIEKHPLITTYGALVVVERGMNYRKGASIRSMKIRAASVTPKGMTATTPARVSSGKKVMPRVLSDAQKYARAVSGQKKVAPGRPKTDRLHSRAPRRQVLSSIKSSSWPATSSVRMYSAKKIPGQRVKGGAKVIGITTGKPVTARKLPLWTDVDSKGPALLMSKANRKLLTKNGGVLMPANSKISSANVALLTRRGGKLRRRGKIRF